MKSLDYYKPKMRRKVDPSMFEIVEYLTKGNNLIEKYSSFAIKRKYLKAIKAGYITEQKDGMPSKVTEKGLEFFNCKHI
jgi:hypothetical protein